jgi:hypothetical protein
MSNRNRTKTVAIIGAVAVAAVAVAAFAYWSGSGSGTGSGNVGTSSSVALTGTVAPGSAPGTSQSVSFTAANASKSPVRVSAVHLVGVTVDGAHAACETADFTMANVTENHQVPAEATTEALPNDGSLVYANTPVSQDACKGATLTLTLSSS